jgi:hypothetical protein
MDRRVPALAATDRVRAADVVCLGAQAVVLAFAIGVSDRMDRRQIEHVKAHVAQRGNRRTTSARVP